jgi:Family of unknown function (DUF5519)
MPVAKPSIRGTQRCPECAASRREFAHLHADDLLDIRLPRTLQSGLRGDPRARLRKSSSDWLEFEFDTSEDVADALALAREAWAAAEKPGPGAPTRWR